MKNDLKGSVTNDQFILINDQCLSICSTHFHLQQGVALVLVLWILSLLTIMTMGYSATMRTDIRLTAHGVQSAQARALSQGGIWIGVRKLLDPASAQDLRYDGSRYVVPDNVDIEIKIVDEAGKIDLNTAQTELLRGLLDSVGLNDNQAESLAQAIEDWRDSDNLNRVSGAEDTDYFQAGYTYGAKNGPFNTVGELRQVVGMTEEIFQSLAPALTVFSHQNSINPDTAPKEALLALPGRDVNAVEAYYQNRQSATSPDFSAQQLEGNYVARVEGRIFTIISTGKVNDTIFTTSAVVMLKEYADFPFSILSWAENNPAN